MIGKITMSHYVSCIYSNLGCHIPRSLSFVHVHFHIMGQERYHMMLFGSPTNSCYITSLRITKAPSVSWAALRNYQPHEHVFGKI